MTRVFIVYDTKYGNTKLVAEKIAEGIREAGAIETEVTDIEKVDYQRLAEADAILIGAPIHAGGPSRAIMKFIDKLSKLKLKAKQAAVFDTYMGKEEYGNEKGARKIEEKINEKAPALKIVASGLSIRVDGMKGPISEGELPKAREFGKKIAAQLTT